MIQNKNFIIYLISCVIIYALICYPAIFIPFHSDDYSYFLNGLSLETHINHYLNWSGRFITDYTSSIMLNLFNKSTYMAINSAVLLIVLINISLIPTIIAKDKFINSNTVFTLWGAFFMYWLCNPNLGQTTFWLVGSANYLWTLMWASLYMIYLLNLLQKDIKLNLPKTILLVFLGFFAGLSNEATGISVAFFTFILFFIYKNQRKTLIIAFIPVLVGFLFLYFSPGNFKRLNDEAFANWRNLPLSKKIISHLFGRLPKEVLGFWLAFASIIFSFFSLFVLKNEKKFDTKFFLFAFIFFILALFSVFVFVKSPVMPPRSLNTFNFFIVLCASFSLYAMLSLNDKKKILFASFLFLVFVLYFTLSWMRFTYAIKQTDIQAQIREKIIKNAKEKGENEAKIPDWYFTKLVKNRDQFDLYKCPYMPRYYDIEKITWLPAKFNYAIIKTQKPILSENLPNNLKLNLFYDNPYRLFSDNRILAFEFNKDIKEIAEQNGNLLLAHLFLNKNEEFITTDFMQIEEKFYYLVNLNDKKIENIEKINLLFYNPQTQNASIKFSINLKDNLQK